MLTESPRVLTGKMRLQQRRLVDHLLRLQPGVRGLTRIEHAVLSRRAHFRSAPHELGWGPAEVVAHLRDHTLWTLDALQRVRSEHGPVISPPGRSRPGGRADADVLCDQVRIANALLASTSTSLSGEELQQTAVIAGEGVWTLHDILMAELSHLEDHLAQLDALQGGPS